MKTRSTKEQNAYAFFDYNGTDKHLLNLLERARIKGNFDDLRLTILDQKERNNLTQELVARAKRTDVYGSLNGNYSQELFHELIAIKPKKAYKLSHVVLGVAPRELGESTSETAGMLDYILGQIGSGKHPKEIFRGVVLFPDSRENYQTY